MLAGKEGPVHDVQWSYSGKEFAVVYGCILLFYSNILVFTFKGVLDLSLYKQISTLIM